LIEKDPHSGGVLGAPVKTAHGELDYGFELFSVQSFVPLHDVIEARAGFEVLKDSGDRIRVPLRTHAPPSSAARPSPTPIRSAGHPGTTNKTVDASVAFVLSGGALIEPHHVISGRVRKVKLSGKRLLQRPYHVVAAMFAAQAQGVAENRASGNIDQSQ
jgi:hypothetical protein